MFNYKKFHLAAMKLPKLYSNEKINTSDAPVVMHPVFKMAMKDVGDYINTRIQWPFDNLLIGLKNEIQGKDNEALQAWRVQMYSP